MTDLTITDDWLAMRCLEERNRIIVQVNRFKLFIADWQPRPCPPHPEFCPAGGTHAWERDSGDRGSWCACIECGTPCDGPFYPEERE